MVDVGLDEGVGGLDCRGGEEVGLGGGGWHGEESRMLGMVIVVCVGNQERGDERVWWM